MSTDQQDAAARHAMEAMRNGNFALHAQPIRPLDPELGGHNWLEVLIRPPCSTAAFVMRLAEAEALAPELDLLIWRKALGQVTDHQQFSLNLSGQTLSSPSALPAMLKLVELARVDPRRIVVEITETAPVTNIHAAMAFAQAFRDLGAHLALDDVQDTAFTLPLGMIDYVKIDRQVLASGDDHTLQALCALAQAHGRQVVAEGVESPADLRRVVRHGAHWYQGFYDHGEGALLAPAGATTVAA